MALKLRWKPDDVMVDNLERMAVPTEVRTILFSKIDLRESQVNGARIKNAIREHKVEDYMQGYRNGDKFPMVVVHKTATGYVVLGGNQRCEAINRLIKEGELPKTLEIEAHFVDTADKLLLESIARSANVTHGEGDSKAERLQQAIHCVRSLGMSVKNAAKLFVIGESSIGMHMRADEQRKKLMLAGIEAQHVPNAAIEPLGRLEYDEPAQMKLGTLIAQHNPSAERVRQLVATVSKQSSAPDRLTKIKEFEKEMSAVAHSSNGHNNGHSERSKVLLRPRRDKLVSILTRLVNFLEHENDGEAFSDLVQLQVTSAADVELVLTKLKKLRYRLGVLLK